MASATSMSLTIFGTLARRRRALGKSQQECADRIGVTRSHFNKAENAHRCLDTDQMFALAAFLGVDICVQTGTTGQKSQATERKAS